MSGKVVLNNRIKFSALSPSNSLGVRAGTDRAAALLPVGEAVLVDVHVVELDAPQLLREHVRVLARAAGAVDDDGLVLVRGVGALFEELVDLVVDVGFPHGERARAGDVAGFVDRGAAGVEEEGAGGV